MVVWEILIPRYKIQFMAELIAIIIFLGSLLGIGVILVRKIPVLRELPLEIEKPQESLFLRFRNQVKTFGPLKSFSSESILHKLLSKTRILTLKMESKISAWQHRLREKEKKKKEIKNDTYWQDLKKSTNNRKDKNSPA